MNFICLLRLRITHLTTSAFARQSRECIFLLFFPARAPRIVPLHRGSLEKTLDKRFATGREPEARGSQSGEMTKTYILKNLGRPPSIPLSAGITFPNLSPPPFQPRCSAIDIPSTSILSGCNPGTLAGCRIGVAGKNKRWLNGVLASDIQAGDQPRVPRAMTPPSISARKTASLGPATSSQQ